MKVDHVDTGIGERELEEVPRDERDARSASPSLAQDSDTLIQPDRPSWCHPARQIGRDGSRAAPDVEDRGAGVQDLEEVGR